MYIKRGKRESTTWEGEGIKDKTEKVAVPKVNDNDGDNVVMSEGKKHLAGQ